MRHPRHTGARPEGPPRPGNAEVATTAANLPDAILHDRATEIIPLGRAGSQIRGDALSLGGTGDEDDD